MFKPDDHEDKMQLLGGLIGEELGVEFIDCRYVGENLAFKGSFRYKGDYIEATLATRKELEDNMPGKEIENTKEIVRKWKLQVNKNDG